MIITDFCCDEWHSSTENSCAHFFGTINNHIYLSNTTEMLDALSHIKYILKVHGSQGREGNRKYLGKSGSRLKVSNAGALIISIGSLFHKIGSLTEKAAFLRIK